MYDPNPYNELLYSGYPYPQTHPDRLATLATLFGMNPAPVESCRMLELGCGEGANLIPMALVLPGSEFIGIDLAQRPISKGTGMVEALGLRNITLRQMDVLNLPSNLGPFDYIIAHGLYSWVPANVQDKILSVCKKNLAPEGVAYVSYNTYPGGHLRQMTREMMLFHVRHVADPEARLGQARGFLKSLSESRTESDAYKILLEQEADRVLTRADEALFHDDLASVNTPVYFYQFMEHAERHGLQYLTEARLAESQVSISPPTDESANSIAGDVVAKEQYFDFLQCRTFRQTLLCHREIQLAGGLKPESIRKFYLASSALPISVKPDIASVGVVEQFRVVGGAVISADHPLAKAALMRLGEVWPQSLAFDPLLGEARALTGSHRGDQDPRQSEEETVALCKLLLAIYGVDLLELRTYRPNFLAVVTERPSVSPLARLQARHGSIVTTLRHTSIELKDNLARHLLGLMDGTRDRAALRAELTAAVESSEVNRGKDASAQSEGQRALAIDCDELEQKLSELARLALLIA